MKLMNYRHPNNEIHLYIPREIYTNLRENPTYEKGLGIK